MQLLFICSIVCEIFSAVIKYLYHIKTFSFRNGHDVPIQDGCLVPDIFLLDLQMPAISDNEVGEELGHGGFGVVHRLQATYNGREIAVKCLLKNAYNEQATSKKKRSLVLDRFPDYRREIVTTKQLKHPCIIEVIGVIIEKLGFVMECAPLGDLDSLLKRKKDLQQQTLATNNSKDIVHGTLLGRVLTFKVIFQIISAVDYLHQQGVIHTDLKTDNIMVFSTDPNECINVKLADYGISQKNVRAGVVRGQAGKHIFVAPEVRDGKAYNEKVKAKTIFFSLKFDVIRTSNTKKRNSDQ